MVKANVAWVPTFDIYEASRDLQPAQNQFWLHDHLHPALAEYFRRNPRKENYPSGWRPYGTLNGWAARSAFATTRASSTRSLASGCSASWGCHPIKVIQHATSNNARILGVEDQLGAVRAGYLADLIVVNGNPLDDIKVRYPLTEGAGIEWTIKDGIACHAPTLAAEVRDIVRKACRAASR